MNHTRNITTFEPNSKQKLGFIRIWVDMVRAITSHYDLLVILFKRDFLFSYRKTILGVSWIILSPVIASLSWIFMQFTGVINSGNVGIPYPIYILINTCLWGLFVGFYKAASETLSSGAHFITLVRFPHEILFFKQVAQHLVSFLVFFILNLLIMLLFHITPSWKIIFFPLTAMPFFFIGAGIGLLVSLYGVLLQEVQKVSELFFGILIWITPIVYSSEIPNSHLQMITKWNPLTHLVKANRELIIEGHFPTGSHFYYSYLFSIFLFLICWKWFFLAEDRVIERMQ